MSFISLLIVLTYSSCSPSADPIRTLPTTPPPPGTSPSRITSNASETEVTHNIHRYINDIRLQHGLKPVTIHHGISQIARSHSANMAKDSSSKGQLTIGHKRFLHREHQVKKNFNMWGLGENVAALRGIQVDQAQWFSDNWLRSKKHRETILQADWKYTGIGVYRNPDGSYFATQLFAHDTPPAQFDTFGATAFTQAALPLR